MSACQLVFLRVTVTQSTMTAGKRKKEAAYGSGTGTREPSEDGGEREETLGGQGRENSDEGKAGGTEKSRVGVNRTNSQTRRGYGTDRYAKVTDITR